MLKSLERYPKYIKINYDLISNEYDLFKMTSNAKYFNDAHKHTLEIHDYLKKMYEKCKDYPELKALAKECQEAMLDMPIVPSSASSSAMRSYILDAKSYARDADRVSVPYNVWCRSYGVQ